MRTERANQFRALSDDTVFENRQQLSVLKRDVTFSKSLSHRFHKLLQISRSVTTQVET